MANPGVPSSYRNLAPLEREQVPHEIYLENKGVKFNRRIIHLGHSFPKPCLRDSSECEYNGCEFLVDFGLAKLHIHPDCHLWSTCIEIDIDGCWMEAEYWHPESKYIRWDNHQWLVLGGYNIGKFIKAVRSISPNECWFKEKDEILKQVEQVLNEVQ